MTTGFNPRPLIRAGDTGVRLCRQAIRRVSIHARSFERAILNPGKDDHLPLTVSIHARSFERAIRLQAATDKGRRGVSIHARSFERAIPKCRRCCGRLDLFQSTPAHSSGRYMRLRPGELPPWRFNPRPLIRAGDTLSKAPSPSAYSMFQSTPAHSSGRYGASSDITLHGKEFQSTPAHSSGRYPPQPSSATT